MADAKRASALRACNSILRPLVGLLLRMGLGAGEFAAISRRIFVHSAVRHLTRAGRKATHSQVAIITGLTRADVKRILENPNEGLVSRPWEQHRASRVMKGWRTDPEFLQPNGQPKELPFKARKGSFASLTGRYSGDIPPRAMLDELLSMGVVRQGKNGTVRLHGVSARQSLLNPREIDDLGVKARQLMDTLTSNLYREAPARYVGTTARSLVNDDLLPFLHARISKTGANFIEQVEDQLRHPPLTKRTKLRRTRGLVEFGVTIFTHELSPQSSLRSATKKSRMTL